MVYFHHEFYNIVAQPVIFLPDQLQNKFAAYMSSTAICQAYNEHTSI